MVLFECFHVYLAALKIFDNMLERIHAIYPVKNSETVAENGLQTELVTQ